MKFTKYEMLAIGIGYTMDKEGNCINTKNGNTINGVISNRGYKILTVRLANNKSIKIQIHRIQAYLKFGEKIYENGIEVRHIDGNPLNNSWDNIEIGTHNDNMQDIQPEIRLEKAYKASSKLIKYSKNQVIKIKEFYEKAQSYKLTMEHFNISSKGTLSYILKKRQ